MLWDLWDKLLWMLGADQYYETLSAGQIIFRTIIIYVVALLLIRVGKRRFMGNYSAFDILLGFVVGSIMSRAITGGIGFISMIFVLLTLMGLHWIISTFTYYFDKTNGVIKDTERQLITDGEINEDAMQKSKLGENDLLQALRQKANVEKPEEVKSAYLERDGSITVIPKKRDPQIIEIKVEKGVQIVKIIAQ